MTSSMKAFRSFPVKPLETSPRRSTTSTFFLILDGSGRRSDAVSLADLDGDSATDTGEEGAESKIRKKGTTETYKETHIE
jgi:hypothetical protein